MAIQPGLNPRLDPVALRKRVLVFYFAAGVNLLMAFWAGSVAGGGQGGGAVTVVTLVFIGFGGLNYYMARKLQKYLKRLQLEQPVETRPGGDVKSDEVTK